MRTPATITVLSLVLAITAVSVACGVDLLLPRPTRPLVIAHRGASGYLPEHTLPGFALAYGLGADVLEPDIVLSKDGTAVVLHDVTLDTVTNVKELFPNRVREDGRFYAIDFTVDELKKLSVSARIDPRTGRRVYPGRFPAGKSEFRIPTLAEMIELLQGLNHSTGRDVGIYPEIKQPKWHREQGQDISKIVLTVLSRYGYRDHQANCFLQCFDAMELNRLRNELKTDLKLVQLFSDDAWNSKSGTFDEAAMRAELAVVAEYADAVGPSLRLLVTVGADGTAVPNNVAAEAHSLGLLVHAHAFRRDALPEFAPSYEELVRLYALEIGIDGFFTDFPDVTRDLLERFSAR